MHTASFSPATQRLKINAVTFETKKALLIRPKSDCVPNTLHMLILDFLPSIPYKTRKHAHRHTCRGIDIIHPYGSAALPKVFLRKFATLRHFPNPERSRKKNGKKTKNKQRKGEEKQYSKSEKKKKHVLQGCNGCPTRLVGSQADRRFQASEWQPPRSRPSEETRQQLHDLSTD